MLNGTTTSTEIAGLQEFSDYTITVSAVNRAGSNQDSVTIATLPAGMYLKVEICVDL